MGTLDHCVILSSGGVCLDLAVYTQHMVTSTVLSHTGDITHGKPDECCAGISQSDRPDLTDLIH